MGALKIYSINVSALSRISTRAKKKIISQQEPIGSCFTGNQTAVCNKFNVCISVCDYFPFFFQFHFKGPCRIDAAFRWSNGFVYLFLGSRYYRYNETRHGIDPGYPRPIRDHWNGIPFSIDGVFRYVNGITYFFKGNQYYRFNDSSLSVDPGYPRPISNFWLGVPDDIDDVIK